LPSNLADTRAQLGERRRKLELAMVQRIGALREVDQLQSAGLERRVRAAQRRSLR